jgi:ABC-type sugar transport system ATPase subunit
MLVSARGLSKSYGGVRVLADLDFDLRPGEIRALVGENGAGKSTFIKILSGAVDPDAGTASLEGTALPLGNPLAVRERGVSIVYQELTLVPDLSVAANVFLGRERGTPVLRSAEMTRRAQTMLDELGVSIDARVTVRSQSVAHQQMVEIARALITDAKVLILDEPSATLSDADVSRLFEVLRRLQARGLASSTCRTVSTRSSNSPIR